MRRLIGDTQMKSKPLQIRRLVIMGAGPGSPDLVSPRVIAASKSVDVLYAFGRTAALFDEGQQVYTVDSLADLYHQLDSAQHNQVGVVVSGSPAIFSVAPLLVKRYADQYECEVIGGQSSIEYFFSKLGLALTQSCLVSAHGKTPDAQRISRILHHHPSVTLTLSSGSQMYEIAEMLCGFDSAFCAASCVIGSDLSYEEEQISRLTLGQLCPKHEESADLHQAPVFSDLSLLYIASPFDTFGSTGDRVKHTGSRSDCRQPRAFTQRFGRSADEFIRIGKTPITKPEVRSVILSKLQLEPQSTLLDVGAGSGSVCIEACLLCPDLRVVAVEKISDACRSLIQNAEQYGVSDRITVIEDDIVRMLGDRNEEMAGSQPGRSQPESTLFSTHEITPSVLSASESDHGGHTTSTHTAIPTHIFFGGALGSLETCIAHLMACARCADEDTDASDDDQQNHAKIGSTRKVVRVVAAAVTLASAAYLEKVLTRTWCENYEMVQISVSRSKEAGSFMIMDAENSIYIVSADVVLTKDIDDSGLHGE